MKVVGREISEKIISSVSPLLTFAQLEVRTAVCNVLTALSESDSSVLIVVLFVSLTIFFSTVLVIVTRVFH